MSIALLVREMSAIVQYFVHSLALPFFGIGMKTDLFFFICTLKMSEFMVCKLYFNIAVLFFILFYFFRAHDFIIYLFIYFIYLFLFIFLFVVDFAIH